MEESFPEPLYRSPSWLKPYAFLVMLLLPIDWFTPTGALLREFGAKPAIPLLTLGGIYGMTLLPRVRSPRGGAEFTAVTAFAALLAFGFLAGLINFLMGWSGWNYVRSPLTQLVNQAMIVVVAAVSLIGNSRLARAYPLAELLARYLPAAAVIHLIIFALEASGLVSDSSLPLVLFRPADPTIIERPTGLFSEPSYFGTFAGLYGGALLCLPGNRSKRLLYAGLAIAMGMSSLLIGAKTIVVVAGMQALFFFLRRAKSLTMRISAAMLLLIVGGSLLFFMQKYSVLNVEENLSSADRLGSATLAANVAKEGYALTGIGFGQFHFLYRQEFAPSFLMLSREARTQLTPEAVDRASTYNFYLRVLLETGLAGLILVAAMLRHLWYARVPPAMTYASLLFAGALGFLLTQDTYFYPPLILASALIVSAIQSRQSHAMAASGVPA